MNTKLTIRGMAIAAMALLLAMGVSAAAVDTASIKVDIQKSTDNEIPFPVAKDDLVNAGSKYLSRVTFENYAAFKDCNEAALNDGELGAPSNQKGVTFDLDGEWITTFVLDTAKSPKGFDISSIITTAGWPPNRACQSYELFVAKVSAPTVFVSLGTYEVDATGEKASQIKLTAKKDVIAANVAAVRFKFMVPEPKGGSETAYREVDVIGKPSK